MDARELEQRLAEQETLLELGLAMAETLDLRRVLTLALEQAEQFCAAETSSIWELDEASGELAGVVARAPGSRVEHAPRDALDCCASGDLVDRHRGLLVFHR